MMTRASKRRQKDPVVDMVDSSQQTTAQDGPSIGSTTSPLDSTNQQKTDDNGQTGELSSDSDNESPSSNSANSKPKLQIFKGVNDKVTIENWTKRFDMIGQF